MVISLSPGFRGFLQSEGRNPALQTLVRASAGKIDHFFQERIQWLREATQVPDTRDDKSSHLESNSTGDAFGSQYYVNISGVQFFQVVFSLSVLRTSSQLLRNGRSHLRRVIVSSIPRSPKWPLGHQTSFDD